MSDQKKNDHPLEDMLSQLQDALSQAVDAAGQDQGTTGDEQASAPGEQQISDLLPVLPVRDVVVFNYMILPLFIGREKSVKAVEAALKKGRHLLVCTQKEESTEDPGPNDLYTAGTVVQVMRMLKMPDGRIKILVQGASRARVEGYHRVDPYLEARITVLQEETPPRDAKIEALLRSAREQSEKVLQLRGVASPDILAVLQGVEEPGRLADLIAANLRMKTAEAQRILEAVNPVERLMLVNIQLEREVEVATMQAHIQSTAREGMDKAQKEYFLREQIKAIRHELGDAASEGEEELDELRKALDKAGLPKDVRKEADKQLRRLSGMHADSSEANVVRTYLDWLVELPWKKLSRDRLDIAHAKAILDEDHYGLDKIKDRILEFLSVRKLNPQSKGPILCFAGPPGVGKTSLGRSIARALGRHFQRLSLGGMHDEAEIRGHRRTYIGAMPGRIISAITTAKSTNPVILLDEIDKLAGDFRGDPAAALLEALDPEQNSTFNDHFIDIPFDLSHVLFITTANDLGSIPGPLRDRMDVIELPSYTRVEKYNIARKHLLPKQLKACGLTGKVTMNQSALYGIIDGYTREAGVRNLERTITSVLRKCARKIASGEVESVAVTAAMLEELLGPRIVKPDFLNRTNAVGIANGLAWTSVGGETLPIEVQVMDNGTGKITVTGSLGDVMKESAQLAVTWVRVHAEEYGIDPERLKKCDLHIHAPEGAVPKDGPSAGVTLTTALVSCLSGVPVRGDVAMTGEITLHGNVLPIGGLREKSMAAYREGMKTVLIPKDNEPDLYDVDEEVKKNLTFLPMQNLSQVLAAALLKPKAAKSTAGRPRTKKSKAGESRIPAAPEKNQPGAVC